ncbi:hypothetical protein BDV98DRAFT_169223 [Pterulicium gracile]|uniref:Uncharacterized protein n=1 Tax=Pterulicium gracile TaxID=1884261 RepID=A0A5C3QG69_9AGAR|nr:hypothetical protein BDV98DRAFT_169223 [Pterula gracilis]
MPTCPVTGSRGEAVVFDHLSLEFFFPVHYTRCTPATRQPTFWLRVARSKRLPDVHPRLIRPLLSS